MASLVKIFKKVTDGSEPDVQECIHDKICVFNSIVSILAQILEDLPFQDHKMPLIIITFYFIVFWW